MSIFPVDYGFQHPSISDNSLLLILFGSSHQLAKILEFSFNISPSNEHSGLISLRMDSLDLLEVQGPLKNLLQQCNSKASILMCSAIFIVQLPHPYITTGKTITLTRWTFVGKVMSLLLNMLSRLVTTFLPRSKCLLISWLQSPSAVKSLSRAQLVTTPWTAAFQTPPSMGFSRQEYWSGLSLPCLIKLYVLYII